MIITLTNLKNHAAFTKLSEKFVNILIINNISIAILFIFVAGSKYL